LLVVLSGCGGQQQSDGASPSSADTAAAEPVELSIVVPPGYLTDEEFQAFFVDPLKKTHPNITLTRLKVDIVDTKLEAMVAQGEQPDLMVSSSNTMDPMHHMGFTMDIEPLLKAEKFNLDRIQKEALAAVKVSSGGQYLEAIPYDQNFQIMFYNKGIFDKFGAGYPKDGMTWEEVTELARKLTRTEAGIQYVGIRPGLPQGPAAQLGQGWIDPKTLKATVNNDNWKKVFEMEKKIFSIPGNGYSAKVGNFYKDKTLAMNPTNNQIRQLAEANGLDWDMATYPEFKEAPGIGGKYDLHVIAVTANSKHKTAAVQVIASVLSDEAQTKISRVGRLPVLQNDKIRDEFGKDLDYLQGKNIPAVFKMKSRAFTPTSYDRSAAKVINETAAKAVFDKGIDINTALSQAEEQINKIVAEEQSK
jgi:multiple sugar transport system substrate-binding protein